MIGYKIFLISIALGMVNLVLAHGIADYGEHSNLGNLIFSLVLGIGIVYLIIVRNIIEWRKNDKK